MGTYVHGFIGLGARAAAGAAGHHLELGRPTVARASTATPENLRGALLELLGRLLESGGKEGGNGRGNSYGNGQRSSSHNVVLVGLTS